MRGMMAPVPYDLMEEPDLEPGDVLDMHGLELEDIERAIGRHWTHWAKQCHVISLAIVKSGVLDDRIGASRVVRGSARHAGLNHSWIVIDEEADSPEEVDPYSDELLVLDPTMWSYRKGAPVLLETIPMHYPWGHAAMGLVPPVQGYHGVQNGTGPVLDLDPAEAERLSPEAAEHLAQVGPMDAMGWASLVRRPVDEWPAGDIVAAAYRTDAIRPLVPVDLVGNATSLNPEGLYW